MTLEHTSPITASSSRTSASVDGKGKRLARHSWSRRSIKWAADDSSKKQQMQWTLRGAHLLLQSRTRVLNEDLDDLFRHWYPKFRSQPRRNQSERRLDPRLLGALPGSTGKPASRIGF